MLVLIFILLSLKKNQDTLIQRFLFTDDVMIVIAVKKNVVGGFIKKNSFAYQKRHFSLSLTIESVKH